MLEMDIEFPGWLLWPKLPPVEAHAFFPIHPADLVVEGPIILGRNTQSVTGSIRNQHLVDAPTSRRPAVLADPKTKFAPLPSLKTVLREDRPRRRDSHLGLDQ